MKNIIKYMSQEEIAYLRGRKEWPFGSVLAMYELGFFLIGV